jgi:outer membrane lipoprotein-sorting protein
VKGYIIFFSIAVLHAQGVPDAASILESSRHAFDRYQSYQFRSTVTISSLPSGVKNEPVRIVAFVAGTSPGMVHIDSETRVFGDTGGVAALVSDGQTTWTYQTERNLYRKQAEEESIDSLLDLVGAWSGSLPEDAGSSPGTVREESIDVDGEKHDCWVVEKTASKIRPFSWYYQYELDDFNWTIWIDKISGIGWQTTVIGKLGRGVVGMQVTIAKTGLKLNPRLPDSLFTFTPPGGSRETRDFNIGGVH